MRQRGAPAAWPAWSARTVYRMACPACPRCAGAWERGAEGDDARQRRRRRRRRSEGELDSLGPLQRRGLIRREVLRPREGEESCGRVCRVSRRSAGRLRAASGAAGEGPPGQRTRGRARGSGASPWTRWRARVRSEGRVPSSFRGFTLGSRSWAEAHTQCKSRGQRRRGEVEARRGAPTARRAPAARPREKKIFSSAASASTDAHEQSRADCVGAQMAESSAETASNLSRACAPLRGASTRMLSFSATACSLEQGPCKGQPRRLRGKMSKGYTDQKTLASIMQTGRKGCPLPKSPRWQNREQGPFRTTQVLKDHHILRKMYTSFNIVTESRDYAHGGESAGRTKSPYWRILRRALATPAALAGFAPVTNLPSTTTSSPHGSREFWNWAPLALSCVSTRNGSSETRPACSSSVFEKHVTFLPFRKGSPVLVSMTSRNTVG